MDSSLNNYHVDIKNIIANSPGHVYWKDTKGHYLGCNLLQTKTFGCKTSEEVLGKTDYDFVSQQEAQKVAEIDQKIIMSGLPIVLEEKATLKDGITHTYLSHKVPLKDKSGIIVGILGISFDITDRKKLETKFQTDNIQLKAILENIIDNVPAHIYWQNEDGMILGCNELQAKSAGYKSKYDFIGRSIKDTPWKEKEEEFKKIIREVMTKKKAIAEEEEPVTLNGEKKIFLSRKAPLLNENDEAIGMIGISVDITDLKEAQERALKAEAKAEAERQIKKAVASFAGTVAHDLRTPLTAINLIGEFLKARLPMIVKAYDYAEQHDQVEEPLNPRQKEGLKMAGENIQGRVKVAQDYITFSLKSVKGAAQGERLLSAEDLVPCSIEKCVRKVIDDYPFQTDERAKLHFTCIKDFTFLGNEIFMVRVIENLIKNAFEQIQLKGKGEIYIQCNNHDHHPQLTIKDTAGGVTRSLVESLFQGMNTTKTDGTGIGLSSAKEIMPLFGGDIKAQLVEGDCIAFHLTFPLHFS